MVCSNLSFNVETKTATVFQLGNQVSREITARLEGLME